MKKILIAFLLFIFTTIPVAFAEQTVFISGTVYVDGELQDGVFLYPEGLGKQRTNFNSSVSANGGRFAISKFPVNSALSAAFYGEEDVTVSYEIIDADPRNVVVRISTDNLSGWNDVIEEVIVSNCSKEELAGASPYAKSGNWHPSSNDGPAYCEITKCDDGYLLENPKTRYTKCTPCTNFFPHSASAHVVDGKCVLDTCSSEYSLEGKGTDAAHCTKCTDKIPFSTIAEAVDNMCVATACEPNFTKFDGGCHIDCSTQNVLDKLHATSAALKAGKSVPSRSTRNINYASYCYPTACDTPRYEKRGTGESTTCADRVGQTCAESDWKSIERATGGKYEWKNNQLICNPTCDGRNYEAVWHTETGKYQCDIKKDKFSEPCPSTVLQKQDKNADTGVIREFDKNGKATLCEVKTCKSGYRPAKDAVANYDFDTKCEIAVGDKCKPNDDFASEGMWINIGNKPVCESTACKYPKYHEPRAKNATSGRVCTLKSGVPCEPGDINRLKTNKKIDEHANTGTVSNVGKDGLVSACIITGCEEPYETKDGKTCVVIGGTPCTEQIKNAKLAQYENGKCVLKSCNQYFKINKTFNRCDDQRGKSCEPVETLRQLTGDIHASRGTITDFNDEKITACEITDCVKGYAAVTDEQTKKTVCVIKQCTKCSEKWDDNKKACVPAWNESTKQCTSSSSPKLPQNAKVAYKTCDVDDENHSPYCAVQTCVNKKYEPAKAQGSQNAKNDYCESQENKPCTPTAQYASKEGTTAYDQTHDRIICIPESCTATGYVVDKQTGQCVKKSDGCPIEFLSSLDKNALAGTIATRNEDGTPKECIITKCADNYTIKDQGTVNARCESCNGRVPFADTTKAVNNKCVPDKCSTHFTAVGDACLVKCDDYKSELHAKTVARKAVGPDQVYDSYAQFCYPTACDEKLYTRVGAGEEAYCKETTGKDCKDQIDYAKDARLDDSGKCILYYCKDGYKANKSTNKCDKQIGLPCDGDVLRTTTGDNNANTGVIKTYIDADTPEKTCEIRTCLTGYKPNETRTQCVSTDDESCLDQIRDKHATRAVLQQGKCVLKACESGYFANETTSKCEYKIGQPCPDADQQKLEIDKEHKAHTVIIDKFENNEVTSCKITECRNSDETPSDDGKSCVSICSPEEQERLEAQGAKETTTKNGKCIIVSCKCGYNLTNGTCVKWQANEPCKKKPEHADKAHMVCDVQDNPYCHVETCNNSMYTPSEDHQACVSQENQPCSAEDWKSIPNAIGGTYEKRGGKRVCKPTCAENYVTKWESSKKEYVCFQDCGCGKRWDKNAGTCVGNVGCKATGAKTATIVCKNNKEVCEIQECEDTYRHDTAKNLCVFNRGEDCKDKLESSVGVAVATWHKQGKESICLVDACDKNFKISDDKKKCIPIASLSDEDQKAKVAALAENTQNMKDKETSLVSRTIDTAGIAATGIGGMMLGAAISEQAADADAERAMTAYLETFRCDYGSGPGVKGGTTDNELPGGNDMFNLYTQYATLANDLKTRKEALGMEPGIESEVVVDKATTGLYDDVGTGITGGAYASVARALADPNGEDAKKWNEQKKTTSNTLTAGAVTAGVGAVGSLAANVAVNAGKEDKSSRIVSEYEQKKSVQNTLDRANNKTSAQ